MTDNPKSYEDLIKIIANECSRIDRLEKEQIITDEKIGGLKDELTKLIYSIENNKNMVQGQYRNIVEYNQIVMKSLAGLNKRIDSYVDNRDNVGLYKAIKKEITCEINKKSEKINKMEKDIYGNGNKGLKVETEKLLEKTRMMTWLIGILLSTTTLSLATIIGYLTMKIMGVVI